MDLIQFGFDQDPTICQRGYARTDWSLKALLDSRGHGWQIVDRYGNRSTFMSEAAAIAALLAN